jgi:ATP-binding cassette subfamily B protein
MGDMSRALGASERVFELIDRTPAMNISGGRTLSSVKGKLQFVNVTFAYPSRRDVQILDSFSLTFKPGEVVAIVGPSGSGKTTLAHLILRLYDTDYGMVTLDDADIRDLDPRWLRDTIGFVSQDPFLFATTIRENIAYGNPSASMLQVERAARDANIHEFILSLPDQYDTMCGERGARLSGGQKQRIAIARALLKEPKILIFDEATSALDSESEFLVQQAIERVVQGRTVVLIAHRLSTVRRADVILVMEGGKVIESGTHEELFARGGAYFKLVNRQLQNDLIPDVPHTPALVQLRE